MEQERFLPKEVIESVKKSTLDDNFSHKVMSSLPKEERTPLWHYIIYFFAFVFACFLCYLFGVKLSLDIVINTVFQFSSFLELLFKNINFYIVSTLVFLAVVIWLIRNEALLQIVSQENDHS
ncbi:MAG: hypothetical protein LBF01_02210 [Bacteroidales bacterium]|jgi:hypothetical protein|nr:hypothetical protein [Bacteroidales bacterium]